MTTPFSPWVGFPAIGLWVGLGHPALANADASFSRFTDWCTHYAELAPATQQTVSALLIYTGTEDCATAEARLQESPALALDGAGIVDLRPLSSLTQVRELYLYGNAVGDLRPLASLTQLQKLSISSNQVTSLQGLEALTLLEDLNLGDNQITDLGPLARLTQLQQLYLYDNQITDLAPLVDLTQLKRLSLQNNAIQNVAPPWRDSNNSNNCC